MSKNELERKTLLDGYKYKKLKLSEIATRINLSYRQTGRIWLRYKREGDAGLCHKNRGRKPAVAYEEAFKSKIFAIYQEKYVGFGPTYASEKFLEDDGLKVNKETLRLWLKEEGLWKKSRKRSPYRRQRERKPDFGDLLQIDGSIHKWFGEEFDHHCLLNMVDDATGKTKAKMHKGETTEILMRVFLEWIKEYGIPKAVYVDLKSVYVSPKTIKDCKPDNPNGYSIFERICKKLGVEIIKAYSPQAKGRVERKHRVFQDRLVKDIKLYGLKSIKEVNDYLEEKFLNNINEKFSSDNTAIKDSHRDATPYGDLDQIFCWSYQRHLRNDWSIRFRGFYQVHEIKIESLQPGKKITIKIHLDGQMRFWYGDKELSFHRLEQKPEPPSKSKKYYQPKGIDPILKAEIARKNSAKSPWHETNKFLFKPKLKKVS